MEKVKQTDKYPVVIVGGGPVGLFLAIALQHRDIECVVLEKRKDRITHSRSLGLHPVSLELMEQVGLVGDFLDSGIKIKRGMAFTGRHKIGSISFESCPKPYTYILSLPQYKTEELLENHLNGRKPECLVRGADVNGIEERDGSVTVNYTLGDDSQTLRCEFLVGCDGKNSRVREAAGFAFKGETYPDTYIMGDYSDNTIFGTDAAIFLCKEGLIESFPLGRNRRRWVVKTDGFVEKVTRTEMEKRIAGRIGHDVGEEENYMLSSFGVQKFIADPMARSRVYLAGDAAHILSPIGGQGMNLGWLDAWDLSTVLEETLTDDTEIHPAARNYTLRRTDIAQKAIRRAEINMALGRKRTVPLLRNALIWMMVNTPLSRFMAQLFTMRGLGRWPV